MALAGEPLLLLPGTLCDARLWGPTLDTLRYPASCVPALRGADSAPELARALLREAPPRFALAGFSLGAIVALEMIAQAPARVTRLAIVSGNARGDDPASSIRRQQVIETARRDGVRAVVERDLWQSYVSDRSLGDAQLRILIGDMAEAVGLAAFAEQTAVAMGRADSRRRLPSIAVPTLVVAGAADQVCPPERGAEIAAAISGAEFAELPGVGHFVPLEAANDLSEELRKWLRA